MADFPKSIILCAEGNPAPLASQGSVPHGIGPCDLSRPLPQDNEHLWIYVIASTQR